MGPLALRLDGNGEDGWMTARTQTRPSRRGISSAKMAASALARAARGLVRAGSTVRRMACRAAVKEIRSGSSPEPAAASAMTARIAW
jgi:hypothetical protein